ncbi:hypothetical protein LTSEMIS_5858 [Salmonella enterica subsp. enterica serovar Mississippi str. A4-633]|nr:hypothetical protein LTSEMIS_5858 [Salmonella enterica subsp. enterica serovar Mississippi str. A4-633]
MPPVLPYQLPHCYSVTVADALAETSRIAETAMLILFIRNLIHQNVKSG